MKKIKLFFFTLYFVTLSSCITNEPADFITWRCNEITDLGSRTYLVDMYKSPKDTTLYLFSNFHNVSADGFYDVTVNLKNSKFTFNPLPQQIGSSLLVVKSGSGIRNASFNQIEFNYNIFDGKKEMAVKAIYTR